MIIKPLLFPLLVGTAMLVGCQKNNSPEPLENGEMSASVKRAKIGDYLAKTDTKIIKLAEGLVESSLSLELVKEMHNDVSTSLKYGLDEVSYLTDAMKHTSTITSRKKASRLSASLQANSEYNDLMETIKMGDYQIYWPYSEDWDGKTLPVISFVDTDNEDDQFIAAFAPVKRGDKIVMDTILIDEKYATNNPVWIVRKSDIDYQALPNFSKGEFTKNGILFSTASQALVSNQEKVYTMKLGRFMSSKQYDPWTKGGSEFMIYITETSVNTQLPGSPADLGATTHVNSIFVDRPRKAISKKQWADVNAIGISNWRPEVHKTTLVIMEKDWGGLSGGNEEDIPYDIPVTGADGKTFNVKGSIKVITKDDHVATRVYDRSYIFSNLNFSNGQWTVYNNNNGVNWTLPTVIGQTNM